MVMHVIASQNVLFIESWMLFGDVMSAQAMSKGLKCSTSKPLETL